MDAPTSFALDIASRQYFHKDENGVPIEDFMGMCHRVARHAARAEAIEEYRRLHGDYPDWYKDPQKKREMLTSPTSLDQWIEEKNLEDVVIRWEQVFFTLIYERKFMPGGRILAGSASAYGQLQNCFVLESNGSIIPAAQYDPDSIEGIYELATKLALVTKAGGGCGINISHLRERGAPVKGSGGDASGPVSFLRLLYATTLRLIKQAGVRRGAGMCTLDIDHPDVLDFLTAKDRDRCEIEGAIESFNISVLVPDSFMTAVRNDGFHVFRSRKTGKVVAPNPVPGKYHLPGQVPTSVTGNPNDPLTSVEIPLYIIDNGTPLRVPNYEQAAKSFIDDDERCYFAVPARWLWDEIAEHAWATGDPGVLFVDRINEFNPLLKTLGPIKATNPCVTGDTKILTVDGPRSFEELAEAGEDVLVHAVDIRTNEPVIRWMRNPHKTRENVEVLEVEFDSGLKVRVTPDHNFYTMRGNKVQAKDLTPGLSIAAYSVNEHRDGHLRVNRQVRCSEDMHYKYVHRMVAEAMGWDIEGMIVHHKDENPRNNDPSNLEVTENPSEHNRIHYPARRLRGFTGEGRTPSEATRKKISHSLCRYYAEAGAGNHKVVAVREAGRADVYNGTVDDVHTYIIVDPKPVNRHSVWTGVVSANCGEEPLFAGESCCLGSMNLAAYVRTGRDGKPIFDFWEFEGDVVNAVRFLDDVLTMNVHPIADTEEWCSKLRRVGLGVMGDADMCVKMGVGYASEEAMRLREQVGKTLREAALAASENLGLVRGPFPLAEQSSLTTLRRNLYILSIAPTGTISMVADTSSGIEPIFALNMMRRVGTDYWPRLHPLFEEYLTRKGFNLAEKRLIQIPVGLDAKGDPIFKVIEVPEILAKIMDNGGSIKGLDDLFTKEEQELWATAHDITVEDHIRVQSVWQRTLDGNDGAMPMASISKTINAPSSATVDDVKRIFDLAFDSRLKGITLYRDGSYEDQVLRTDVKNEENKSDLSESSGDDFNSEVERLTTENEALRFEIAGLWEEIHRLEDENAELQRQYLIPTKRGLITWGEQIKATFISPDGKERKVYIYVGYNEDAEPVEVFITDEKGGKEIHPYAAALGKMVSLALKYGIKAEDVADVLQDLAGGSISYDFGVVESVPALVARLLLRKPVLGVPQILLYHEDGKNEKPSPEPDQGKGRVVEAAGRAEVSLASDMDGKPRITFAEEDVRVGPGECPECGGNNVTRIGGCPTCLDCGYGKCA